MTYIEKLFNVRRDEVPRLMVFVAMMFFFIIGTVWANITIIAQFVSNIGSENVAYLLIGDALIIVLTFAVYSSYADRFANDKIMIGLNVIGILGIGVGFVLLARGSNLAYWVLYLVFRSVTEAISVHWGPLVGDYYDTRAAKRIFTLLGGVVRLSNIVAALSLSLLNVYIGIFGGLGVWVATLLAMIAINLGTFVRSNEKPLSALGHSKAEASYVRRLQEGYNFVLGSRYLRLFALASLLMMVLLAAMQFRILAILDSTYADAPNKDDLITQFLSNVTLFGSLIILPFQLFFFNRLVSRVGVEKTNLIFPTTSLLTAVGLVFPSIWMVAVAEFNRNILNVGVRAINDEFMYNAVPMRVKGRTRGFMSGIVQPAGTLLGGLLVALPFVSDVPWLIPFLLVTLGVAYWLVSAAVSRQYGRALVTMIEQENFSFLLDGESRLMIDSEMIHSLEDRLRDVDDDDTRLLMARLLIEARGEQYVSVLSSYARNGSPYLRAGILDAFVSADVRSDDVLALCATYADDPNLEVQKSAVMGLKQLAGSDAEQYLLAASKVLSAPDVTLVAEVVPDLINAQDFYFVKYGTQSLNDLLESGDEQQRAIGVQILGRTRSQRIVVLLMRYLVDRSQVVRLQAAIAIEHQLSKAPPIEEVQRALLSAVKTLMRDPVDRIRLAAVRILEQLDVDDITQRLQPALLDANLEVRAAAVQVLIQYPEQSRQMYEPLLRSGDVLLRRMAAVVMVRLKPGNNAQVMENIDLLMQETYQNIAYIDSLEALERFPSVAVLQDVLQEKNEHNIAEIFYLLGNVYGAEAVGVTTEALKSSVTRARANAIEALDVMLPQKLLDGIVSLTNRELNLQELTEQGVQLYGVQKVEAAVVLRALLAQPRDRWVLYIVIAVLGEIGQDIRERQTAASKPSPLDLLAGDDADADKEDTQPMLAVDADTDPSPPERESLNGAPLTVSEINMLLDGVNVAMFDGLQAAVQRARQMVEGTTVEPSRKQVAIGTIERVILLKRVSFFRHVTIEQLSKVAEVCQQTWYEPGEMIFSEGDAGGQLYVIVQGRVGIEHTTAEGQSARLNTLGAEAFFGEDTLFDRGALTTDALTLVPTQLLILSYEALLGLLQAYPDMSLRVIEALSQQIQTANRRLVTLKRADSGADALFNQLDV